MSSQSEVGHAKNVAQFQLLVVHCEGFGVAYNPANAAISASGLQASLAQAKDALQAAKVAKTAHDNATNAREITFAGLGAFGTRMVGALSAAGATPQTIADARTVLRKLRGDSSRNRPAATDVPVTPDATVPEVSVPPAVPVPQSPGNVTTRRISTSQRSYDQQTDYFAKLLQVLVAESLYQPNEADLAVSALQARLDALYAANLAVQQALAAYENANITRDAALYAPGTGLVFLAADVKQYIKSLYGTGSPHYKTVSGITFRGRK